MDANAKLGPEIIRSDPHPRSANGDLLIAMCERNNLIICNAADLCQGVITRQRITVSGTERSVLDYFILCQEMFSFLSSMKIDEARAYVLTKYKKVKSKTVVTESDHNPIICQFNHLWSDRLEQEKQRYEIFQFNDPEGIAKFYELTSSNVLSNCIKDNNVKQSSKKWLKAFNNILHRSFKKIRITGGRKNENEEVNNLMRAKSMITEKISEILKQLEENPVDIEHQSQILVSLQENIDRIEVNIADLCAEKNMNIIKDHFETITDCTGSFNIPKMWGLKKKLNLNASDVPSAKKDKAGNLITTKNGLLALYKNTYIDRLSHKSIRPEYEDLKNMKENLFELRLQISCQVKSDNWHPEDIENICKSLKKSKARDECGFIYELFKSPYAGPDVVQSLSKMFKLIKEELTIPDFFELMSITSIYKNKGVKSDLANERGIFNVSKVRSIFDKIIYSDAYSIIDENMSFSNVGGRKQRNIRDHLFVLYAAINDVINGTGSSFDIQGYDVIKCFDEMWFEETMNDLWDVKVQDDRFALISKLDEKCRIVVKTPCGTTEMFELARIVLQGSVFGPIKCAVQMDTLGRQSLQTGCGIFRYKDTIDVPALAMIDDVMGMALCGDDSIELNALINSKMESKKLRLGEDKCFKIHVCKSDKKCTQVLKVHESEMKSATQATYLGDVISETGTIDETVLQRTLKATGITSQIISMLSSITLGSFNFDIALVLREAKFVNSIMVNSETWHNVQLKHLQSLEKCDTDLVRKIMNAHSKTALEAFYLELGIYPLRYTLAIRRFMYLWHILHRDDTELIKKVFLAQSCKVNKGDWVKIVQEDRIKYGVTESDEQIASMPQEKFKTLIKKKVKIHAIKYLHEMAQPHSKSENLINKDLAKQPYLSDRRFSKEDVQLLFTLRTRMLECKSNFEHQYQHNMCCRLCNDTDTIEDEDHILACNVINTEQHEVEFSDVYGTVDEQYKVVQVFKKVLRRRKTFMDIAEKTANPSS